MTDEIMKVPQEENRIKSVLLCKSRVALFVNHNTRTITSQGSLEDDNNLSMILEKAPAQDRRTYFEQILEYLRDDVGDVAELIGPIVVESNVFQNHPIEFDIVYELDENNKVFAHADILLGLDDMGAGEDLTPREIYCLDFAEEYIENTLLNETCELLETVAIASVNGIDSLDVYHKLILGYYQED